MAAWLSFVPLLVVALIATSWLSVARWAAHRLATDEFSIPRYVAWCLGVAGGIAGLTWAKNGLANVFGGAALAFLILLGSAVEIRGGELRRKLAGLQLYLAVFVLGEQYLRSRGLLEGTSASPVHAFAIESELTDLVVPFTGTLLGPLHPPAWLSPAGISSAVADVVARHYVLGLALGSFAFVAFALAYLADRPLPAVGSELLPKPRALSLVFALAVVASSVLPRGIAATIVGLVVVGFCPFYVADAFALVTRWLAPLRSRSVLVAAIAALSLVLPVIGGALIALGWVGRLARLRELLPFAALTETPMRRPRLPSLLWLALCLTVVLAASTALGKRALTRASPLLGAGPDICGSVTSSADFARGEVHFRTPSAEFSMDLEETPAPPSAHDVKSLAAVCTSRGARLCSSDEWYLACLCTYPLDTEPGTKWWSNDLVANRAREQRKREGRGPREVTKSAEKQSEVRDLLSGRSEVVSAELGGAALLAGPDEVSDDDWSIDCRARAWLAPSAVETAPAGSIGVRCCR